MSKVLCVLYDDPVDGYPKSYPRDDLPKIERYPGGQTLPTPKAIDFKPGTLLGSVSGRSRIRALPVDPRLLKVKFHERIEHQRGGRRGHGRSRRTSDPLSREPICGAGSIAGSSAPASGADN